MGLSASASNTMTGLFLMTQRRVFLFLLCCALPCIPPALLAAQPATAIYRGEAPTASGPGRRIELRLASNGAMTWLTDYRNNRAPVVSEGRWTAVTLEEIDLLIERTDGKAVASHTIRLIRQGDTLRTTAASASEFGARGLTLTRAQQALPPSAQGLGAPTVGGANPVGGVWRWGGLLSATEKIRVDNPERYTLELQAGGKALVRADCNRGTANWKSDGRGLQIKTGALTKAACPPGSLAGRYLKALEMAAGYRIRGDTLFLDLPGEGGTMTFVRAR
jgi:heat shock protein HslJ